MFKFTTVSLLLILIAFSLSVGTSANEQFIPSTISSEAASFLEGRKPIPLNASDNAEWEKIWKEREARFERVVEKSLELYPAKLESRPVAGVDHLLITPDNISPENQHKILVYVHGGAYVLFSPRSTLLSSLPAAHYSRSQVLSLKYPLAWDKPYPAARDTIIEAYKELLKSYEPNNIAMYGDSAGGGMLVSAVLELEKQGIPLPSALGLVSPWVDAQKTGDSLTLLAGADPVLDYEKGLKHSALLYAGNIPLDSPGISPIYAKMPNNFPPSYISTGTRDLFLSHCARLHRKLVDANIPTKLFVYEGMWHVFQVLPIPEAKSAWQDMVSFLESYWGQ